MEMMTVMDLGLRKSTGTRRMNIVDVKQTHKNKNIKPAVELEEATSRTTGKNRTGINKIGKLRMTTPNKVITASPRRRQPRGKESPRNLNLKGLKLQPTKNKPVIPEAG